jgi:hypothetical protein
MRTLICLSGRVRHWEPFVESFRRQIVARLPRPPDFAGHFPTPETDAVEALREMAGSCLLQFEDDPAFRDSEQYELHMMPQRHGARGNLLQWHSMARCEDLKRELERHRGAYDLVIWTRPDLYFATPLDDRIPTGVSALWFPAHDSWTGRCDRFGFGPSDLMSRRMRVYDYFLSEFHPVEIRRPDGPRNWNPERLLLHHVRHRLKVDMRKSRVVTLRLREAEGRSEVCEPGYAPHKFKGDGMEDPEFRRAMRCLRRLAWRPHRQHRPREQRLPLDIVAAALDAEPLRRGLFSRLRHGLGQSSNP